MQSNRIQSIQEIFDVLELEVSKATLIPRRAFPCRPGSEQATF